MKLASLFERKVWSEQRGGLKIPLATNGERYLRRYYRCRYRPKLDGAARSKGSSAREGGGRAREGWSACRGAACST
eukprot:3373260-Rhodomonas_salina.1